jgi:hypothetical protein
MAMPSTDHAMYFINAVYRSFQNIHEIEQTTATANIATFHMQQLRAQTLRAHAYMLKIEMQQHVYPTIPKTAHCTRNV